MQLKEILNEASGVPILWSDLPPEYVDLFKGLLLNERLFEGGVLERPSGLVLSFSVPTLSKNDLKDLLKFKEFSFVRPDFRRAGTLNFVFDIKRLKTPSGDIKSL